MKNKAFLLVLALLAAAAACSVKEDRTECPCILQVDLQNILSGENFRDMTNGMLSIDCICEGKYLSAETYMLSSCPSLLEKTVPRSGVQVIGTLLPGPKRITGGKAYIETGQQADSLYACRAVVDTRGEEARVELDLYKQFSTVYISVITTDTEGKAIGGAAPEDLFFKAVGTVAGFDAEKMEPLEGAFECDLKERSRDGELTFRMPRQLDAGIILKVTGWKGSTEGITVPMGWYLERAGYDFDAAWLPDIHLQVNISPAEITISVLDWEDAGRINAEI